jgi:hypothetical protein
MIAKLTTKMLLRLFVWIGTKLFDSVVTYSPDEAEGRVLAVHFGVSQQIIANSCRELAENSLR